MSSTAMLTTETAFEMAETLVVLAGDNAWNAARAFGSDFAKSGQTDTARHWRDVARAVLRKISGAMAEPSILDAKPVIEPESLAKPSAGSLVAFTVPASAPALRSVHDKAVAAPIPMRAKRQLALLAAAHAEARAEIAFAKAA